MTTGCNREQGAAPAEVGAKTLGQVPLIVHSKGRQHRFTVEVARTPQEQERGLMERTSLAPDRGMIFPIEPARPTTLWMKNMRFPIDMIFIRPDGTIATIAENAAPGSLDPVVATEAVSAVLEIPGGRAAALGIGSGDRVEWSR